MRTIFLIGEQRSGSNLLRLMLNQHTAIAAPHPPHILERFIPLLPLYGDLKQEANFKKLLEDVCQLVERNPIDWGVVLDRKVLRQNIDNQSLVALFGAIMDSYAQQQQAKVWLCKSLHNVWYADQLRTQFKDALFIYLHRDPRDVVASFQKAIIGEKHPYFITQKWVKLQQACLRLKDELPANRFFTLRYEQLIKETANTLQQLCTFMQVDFQHHMLHYYHSDEAKQAAEASSLWKNVRQPILANNNNKYLRELKPSSIQIIEQLAGKTMDKLGYERYYNNFCPIIFSKEQINSFSEINKYHKKQAFAKANPADVQRRKWQLEVLENIRQRHTCSA